MNEALPTKHELRRQMHEALGSWLYARRATSKRGHAKMRAIGYHKPLGYIEKQKHSRQL